MRDKEKAPLKRRRSAAPAPEEKRSAADIFRQLSADMRMAFRICSILLTLITLYLIASLYTPWTGDIGAAAAKWLLSVVGGSVIVPLLFLLYTALSLLFRRSLKGYARQLCGTFFVFLFISLLLGLNRMTGGEARLGFPFVSSGSFGYRFSSAVYKSTGVLGTFITGLLIIYFALLSFGLHILSYLKLPQISLPSLFSRKKGKRGAKENESAAKKKALKGAPNIAEYDDEGNYFDYGDEDEYDEDDEEYEEASDDERETLPEEDIDYNDPESIAAGQGDLPELIQDPNFNLEESGAGRIKQGIFPPPIEIFGPEESREGEMDEDRAAPLGDKIVRTLEEFGIESRVAEILVGPTVIQFRIQLSPGIKVSRVAALSNDIALAMAVPSLRIEAPIPGKPYVGIEIPNPKRRGIPLRTVIGDDGFKKSKASLPLPFGVAVNGDSVIVGLEELPHLLVAGTTGSGKSVFVNSCIVGLCSKRSPEELRMILVDPKRVEMAVYDRLPHLLTPPVTDPKKAVQALAWLIREMEERYSTFAKIRVRNLEGYNEKVLPKDRLPHIVIVVDELADLMMTAAKEVEEYICRLAQMARATGIHLMLATQRPSVNIITGLIKANIPARVAFTLPSNADSRTIIDCAGAEKLLGKGDMLFLSTKHPKPIRIQSPWIDEKILADWLKYLTNTFGEPDFIEIEAQGGVGNGAPGGGAKFDDEMLEEAIETVLSTGIASASGLQRRLRIGFSRASRLIDMMEQIGIVGAADGARPREILVDEDGAQELLDDARGE
ncbi:MAG: DNA translocase FtsK 4TM domain-containing protein [Synergistaceae bacterium]|nr:DNA translocase FtsK 4TM domain-containing protein [Synergistaceae bacterium]